MSNKICLIVNMGQVAADFFADPNEIPHALRPWDIYDDIEVARIDALRLQQESRSKNDRFVIFEAVEQTDLRFQFDSTAPAVAVLKPLAVEVLALPERAKKKRRKQP